MGMDVGAKKGPRSDINITPLVDVVLVLLIIFMVLTPILLKQLEVNVPQKSADVTIAPPTSEQLVLHIAADGRVAIGPEPVAMERLAETVRATFAWHLNSETLTEANAQERLKAYYRLAKSKEATQGPPVIFFDADDKAKYVRAVKALDTIRDSSSGWTIGMMTESIKQEAQQPAAPGAPGAPGGEQQPGATPPTPEAPK